ncbi:MAG TPA: hypothetical protein VJV03_08380 [Pyrinomonadaceae bacterium]|nr:hypothetical protein [Pyrinomonadaceae bacterium]
MSTTSQGSILTEPAYPAARSVASAVVEIFARNIASARERVVDIAPTPDGAAVEAIIDAAFWASLRREEAYRPKISLAYLPPELAQNPLVFERDLALTPTILTRLAPAVERPGIHLGVWRRSNELRIWGTTRAIPRFCFVLEVIEPGLLVVKYRRGRESGKYINVVVLKGDQIKIIDERGTSLPDCPELVTALLGFGATAVTGDAVNVLVQLAASMRAHGRGGSLLVVPQTCDHWRLSILEHVPYSVSPPYSELAELLRQSPEEKSQQIWQEAFIDAVDAIAGLTAVDGAALVTDQFDLLAFGAKIGQRETTRVDQAVVTEPVVGDVATVVQPLELGGTRHLSAAQFVHDQRDSIALVASQDGRFTVFAWSPCEQMVHAHRVESLLM